MIRTELMIVCAPSHPALAEKINNLYRTAYTRVNGQYYPCHPDVCSAMTSVCVFLLTEDCMRGETDQVGRTEEDR